MPHGEWAAPSSPTGRSWPCRPCDALVGGPGPRSHACKRIGRGDTPHRCRHPRWAASLPDGQGPPAVLPQGGQSRARTPWQGHLWRLLASGQDLLLSPPLLPLASTSLITLPSPQPWPCPPHGDSAAPPKQCCGTSCPSPPALCCREGPLPSRASGGTSTAPSPPHPPRR